MRSRTRALTILATLLLLASLVAVGIGLNQEPCLARARNSAGDGVKLLGADFGTRHHYVWGPIWQRALQPILGSHGSASAFNFSEPRLGFLFRYPVGLPGNSTECYLQDEHGCIFEDGSFEPAGNGVDPEISVYDTRVFPRRSAMIQFVLRELQVHVATGGPGIAVGYPGGSPVVRDPADERELAALRYTCANPAHGAYPVWQPEPLPITRQAGGATFTLTDLRLSQAPGAHLNDRVAQFRFAENGSGTRGWFPFGCSIQDATGNQITTYSADDGTRGDTCAVGGLCVREQAWRLKVTFERTLHTSAPPNWLWTVRSAPIPERSAAQMGNSQFRNGDIRLTCSGITSHTEIGAEPGPYRYYSARVDGNAGAEGMRISLVRVRDDRGRDLTLPLDEIRPDALSNPYTTSQVVRGSEPIKYLPVRALPDSRTLDLTFAIYRGRTAEFLVKP